MSGNAPWSRKTFDYAWAGVNVALNTILDIDKIW
jgi:hypothetical protein